MKRCLLSRSVFLYLVLVYSIIPQGCIKTGISDSNSNPRNLKPEVEPAGTTTSDPVSQVIGSGGGSISSTDGNIELIVPAGALDSNTTITMQPITNTCPGGLQMRSPVIL